MSPADVLPDCSTLLFTRLATLDGTPGGTRTHNLRFWRPLLCQLSYWRIFELCRFRKRQWRLAPPLPVPAISGERGSGDSLRGGDPGSLAALGMMFRQPCAQGARAVTSLDDLRHHAGADGAAAFADRETQAFVHRDRVDQRHHHLHVVARHHHLHAFGQLAGAGDVGGAEVELRTVALEERGMTATLVLAQHVHLGLEVRVRLDRTRLAQHLAALDVVTLGAAQQQAGVVARLALVEQLAEHLHARDRGLLGRADADDLDFLAHLDHAALDAPRHHRAAARDREHVLDRHQER